MSALRAVQALGLAVAAAVAFISVMVWLAQSGDGRSEAAEASSAQLWQTIEYRGVRVDIPATWERTDTSKCEFEITRWGDRRFSPCGFKNGVTFYGSALFDPAHGPGVVRIAGDGDVKWSGYTYVGEFAVYVFDNDDRDLVRDILASARESD